jgi:hypothetical protein
VTIPVLHRIAQLAPIMGGVVVFGIYRMHYIAANIYDVDVGLTAKDLCVDCEDSLSTLQPILGQLNWSVTGIFFVMAFIGAVVMLGRIILLALRQRTARNLYGLFAIIVVTVATVGWSSLGDNPFAVKGFNSVLVRSFELLNMQQAEILLNVFTPIILVIVILLMVAAWSALVFSPANGVTEETHLQDKFRHLNTTLFVGATMLVAGVVHAGAMHRLPGVLIDKAGTENWDQLVQGMSASTGAVWTLILLGIYVPSLLVPQTRARHLAISSAQEKTPQKIDEWLLNNGLTSQLSQKLVQILALLSPLIIGGPAAPFLQMVTG